MENTNSSSKLASPFGFHDRLIADFPSQVMVDLTEVCNLACVHCPHPQFKASSHYGARYLDAALNSKMVGEVADHGAGRTQYIRYTSNGEPLVHPHSYDMIEDACRRSGVYVTLTTNGTIMNEKRMRRLLDAGVHMIDVSLDAFEPETYAKIRVHGDLEVTRENVRRLIRWAGEMKVPTKVVVSFVEQPSNASEIEAFRSYWEEQGADFVLIRRLHSSAGAVRPIAQALRERSTAVDRYPCLYPWERVVLNPSGFLSFCPVDWTHGSGVADYRSTTIQETWQSAFYAALREAHLANDFSRHKFCGQCPDWQQTRWPSQGPSYANVVDALKKR